MEGVTKLDGVEAETGLKRDYLNTAEKISGAAQVAKASATSAIKKIGEYCIENPGKAMGIAAGAGALLTFALMKAFGRKDSANDQIISGLLRKGEAVWNHYRSRVEPAMKGAQETAGV